MSPFSIMCLVAGLANAAVSIYKANDPKAKSDLYFAFAIGFFVVAYLTR